MDMNKLTTSLSTIPNDSKIYYSAVPPHKNNSLHNIVMPFKETLPLKFPKRYIRKRTEGQMLAETMQNPERSCVRNFPTAHQSSIFDPPQPRRRAANPGIFHSLSRQSLVCQPLNRSVEDLGAVGNRKKISNYHHTKPDPIIIGERTTQHNSILQRSWQEPRRHRDNGKHCEQTLNWKSRKQTSSYLQIYKKDSQNAGRERKQKFSIFC